MIKKEIPSRSYSGKRYRTNSTNKKYLAIDFNHRCAYCDDLDAISGGYNTYHVEHFAPKEKFPALINTYDNLLYACPYCNCSKSDDWPSEKAEISVIENVGYIDPCQKDYYDHLDRNEETGDIIYKTDLGKYMFEHLKLFLKRHSLIFMVDKLSHKRQELQQSIEIDKSVGKDVRKKEDVLHIIDEEFFSYYFQLQNQ